MRQYLLDCGQWKYATSGRNAKHTRVLNFETRLDRALQQTSRKWPIS